MGAHEASCVSCKRSWSPRLQSPSPQAVSIARAETKRDFRSISSWLRTGHRRTLKCSGFLVSSLDHPKSPFWNLSSPNLVSSLLRPTGEDLGFVIRGVEQVVGCC